MNSVSDDLVKAGIAGSVCAFVSAFLNPLDVTKIRLQNQKASKQLYHGMVSGALRILEEEGIAGWAKGLNASMMRELTYSSIRIGAYEPIRAALSSSSSSSGQQHSVVQHSHHINPGVKFFSALISGGVGAAICNPFDLIKTRFQAVMPGQLPPYQSTIRAFWAISSSQGVKGLYKGWVVTSSRAAILTSAQLGSYDTIKNNILIKSLGMEEGFLLHLVASMASGLITTTAANPVDVIKTRYMSDSKGKYRTPLCAIRLTYQEAGVKGFFKGWAPAYWRLGPHTVFSFLLIERLRSMLGHRAI